MMHIDVVRNEFWPITFYTTKGSCFSHFEKRKVFKKSVVEQDIMTSKQMFIIFFYPKLLSGVRAPNLNYMYNMNKYVCIIQMQ